MRFNFWPFRKERKEERRKSSVEERQLWELRKQERELEERRDLEHRLRYLEAEAELWARKELH